MKSSRSEGDSAVRGRTSHIIEYREANCFEQFAEHDLDTGTLPCMIHCEIGGLATPHGA